MVILAIAFLVLCVVCAAMEAKVTGLYKTFGVYGRISAYFALFGPMGIIAFIATTVMSIAGVENMFPGNLIYLVLAAFGCLFYWNAYRKCPDFLKKKCIISMMISGFGLAVKIAFFFIGAIWKLTGPKEMVDENGETVYVVSGQVYSGDGSYLGDVNSDGNSYTKKQ